MSSDAVGHPPFGVRPPAFRLPENARIGQVKLQVSDLSRSLEYYQKVLGLRVLERSGGGAVLGPQLPGEDVALVELLERRGARPAPRRGLLGLFHFAILLPDRPALGRFLRHLGAIGAQAGMSDHLVSEAIYLQDPDNLGIEVYADRPRTTWRQEKGQLAMTTIPLDVASVLSAGGAESWSGAPAGTTIGHVHLHVGDIERAEAFYHRALGFDKTVWNYPGALFMSAGGYHHHLGTNTWAGGAPSASEEDARLLEWELAVGSPTDVSAAARSLVAAGHSVAEQNGEATASDPWGTRVRIVSQSPRA